jgi:hypothetical protein
MDRGLRGHIAKRQHGVVFINNVGGDFAANNFAKNGIGH